MKRFLFAPLLAIAGIVTASCSSSTSDPPAAWVETTLGINPDGSTPTCSRGEADDPLFSVGSQSNPTPTGGTYEGASISVACQVTQVSTGGPFNVQLQISDASQYTLQIDGQLTSSPGQAQGNISAFFGTNTQSYSSPSTSPCTITLTTETTTPIAPGKIWGSLSCPIVTDTSTNNTCTATANFIFENCSQ